MQMIKHSLIFLFILLNFKVFSVEIPKKENEITLSFAPIVKATAPAVVNIYVDKKVLRYNKSPFFNDPFFNQFFGQGFGLPQERIERSLGSGVVIDGTGLIITNEHVIAQANEIQVTFSAGQEYSASIIYADETTDLALIQIQHEGETFPHLEFSDSSTIDIGDLVVAIGNPFGVGQTVTTGIISAKARTGVGITDIGFFLQTDAAINPGNSGGALISMDGKLVGINTAIFSRSGSSAGLGFAIPSNMVKALLRSYNRGTPKLRHWFGGKTKTISSEEAVKMGLKNKTYVVINSVWNQSPAKKAGLRKNDILISIDNQEIFNLTSLEYYIIVTEDLPTIPLTISREGKEVMINFPIEYPEEIPLRNSTLIKGSNPLNGVVLENISPVLMQELNLDIIKGVVIAEINPNSYAKRANLKKGDILLTINEEVIISVNQAKEILKNNSSQNWEIEISRNNKIYLLKVSL